MFFWFEKDWILGFYLYGELGYGFIREFKSGDVE